MSPERHQQLTELFLELCDLAEEARAAALAALDDEELRREVEELLAHHRPAGVAPVARAPLPGGELFAGRYRIVELLGRGGMGEVYRARDEALGIEIALKRWRETGAGSRERLRREVLLARQVSHRSVCRVHDLGENEGELFLTMELVAGEDLASLLRRVGRLPPEKALDLAQQILGALAAAHQNGVIHGDLKPTNVMVDAEGRARLTDFGIARSQGRRDAGELLVAGTPGYMAPELWLGQEPSPGSDLYAFALVLWEMLRGQPLRFRGEEELEARLLEVAAELRPLLHACLAGDPATRPASALAASALLPGADPLLLAEQAGITPPPALLITAKAPALARSTGNSLLLALLAVLLLGALMGRELLAVARAAPASEPALLRQQAREVASGFGFGEEKGEERSGFLDDPGALPEAGVLFYWRREIAAETPPPTSLLASAFSIYPNDPPPPAPLRRVVILDRAGELRLWRADAASPNESRPLAIDREPAEAGRAARAEAQNERKLRAILFLAPSLWLLLLAGLVVGLRRFRGREVDRAGALRVGLAIGLLGLLAMLLQAGDPRHPLRSASQEMAGSFAGNLVLMVFFGFSYLALEPLARKLAPHSLVAWRRLLDGRFADTAVGGEILLGLAVGAVAHLLALTDRAVGPALGLALQLPPGEAARQLHPILGWAAALAPLAETLARAQTEAMLTLLVLALAGRFLRPPAALALTTLILALFFGQLTGVTGLSFFTFGLPLALASLALLRRRGLLALVAARFAIDVLAAYPPALAGKWWSEVGLLPLAALAGLGLFSWRSARGAAGGR